MAYGRDVEQNRIDAEKYRHRRQKGRGYQAKYRRRLIVEGIPERDAMGDASLVAMVTILAKRNPDEPSLTRGS